LRIVVVEGEGATNNIRQRAAREPMVQVVDENNRPVAGATVLFLLPNGGPGGSFADGSHQLTMITDAKGQAVAHGFSPNNATGAFRIQVQANYLNQTATTVITVIRQSNIASAAGMSGKLISLLAIGGGVAAGAAVAMTRNGKAEPIVRTTAPSATTTIVATAPSVGGRW
jgi:hypothetical protein